MGSLGQAQLSFVLSLVVSNVFHKKIEAFPSASARISRRRIYKPSPATLHSPSPLQLQYHHQRAPSRGPHQAATTTPPPLEGIFRNHYTTDSPPLKAGEQKTNWERLGARPREPIVASALPPPFSKEREAYLYLSELACRLQNYDLGEEEIRRAELAANETKITSTEQTTIDCCDCCRGFFELWGNKYMRYTRRGPLLRELKTYYSPLVSPTEAVSKVNKPVRNSTLQQCSTSRKNSPESNNTRFPHNRIIQHYSDNCRRSVRGGSYNSSDPKSAYWKPETPSTKQAVVDEICEIELTNLLSVGLSPKNAIASALALAQAAINKMSSTNTPLNLVGKCTQTPLQTPVLSLTRLPNTTSSGFFLSMGLAILPPSDVTPKQPSKSTNTVPTTAQVKPPVGVSHDQRFDNWIAHLESTLDLGDFEEGHKLQLLRSKLYGKAAEEFDTFKLDSPIQSAPYKEVKARLIKLFHSMETLSQISVEFHNMCREPEENMRRYTNRMRKAFYLAYPLAGKNNPSTTASREQMLMDRFMEGLQPEQPELQSRLKHKEFGSFKKLIDKAEFLAMAMEKAQTRSLIQAVYAAREEGSTNPGLAQIVEALERLYEKIEKKAATHAEELQNSLALMKKNN
uniref:Uncharacterized protein n=1 Tax=Daphnia galeata TaxID=27404 RepID=A0A8J2S426_9CRUS|nr:unnamed protein product [Daphnia galeata]